MALLSCHFKMVAIESGLNNMARLTQITIDDIGYNSVTKKDVGAWLITWPNDCKDIVRSKFNAEKRIAYASNMNRNCCIGIIRYSSGRVYLDYNGKMKRISQLKADLIELYSERSHSFWNDDNKKGKCLDIKANMLGCVIPMQGY
jgi:hypothetical protein